MVKNKVEAAYMRSDLFRPAATHEHTWLEMPRPGESIIRFSIMGDSVPETAPVRHDYSELPKLLPSRDPLPLKSVSSYRLNPPTSQGD